MAIGGLAETQDAKRCTWARSNCTVAYFHYPLFSSSQIRPDPRCVRDLWRLLYDRGVDVVLNGHRPPCTSASRPRIPTARLDAARGIRQFVGGNRRRGRCTGSRRPRRTARSRACVHGVLKLYAAAVGLRVGVHPDRRPVLPGRRNGQLPLIRAVAGSDPPGPARIQSGHADARPPSLARPAARARAARPSGRWRWSTRSRASTRRRVASRRLRELVPGRRAARPTRGRPARFGAGCARSRGCSGAAANSTWPWTTLLAIERARAGACRGGGGRPRARRARAGRGGPGRARGSVAERRRRRPGGAARWRSPGGAHSPRGDPRPARARGRGAARPARGGARARPSSAPGLIFAAGPAARRADRAEEVPLRARGGRAAGPVPAGRVDAAAEAHAEPARRPARPAGARRAAPAT